MPLLIPFSFSITAGVQMKPSPPHHHHHHHHHHRHHHGGGGSSTCIRNACSIDEVVLGGGTVVGRRSVVLSPLPEHQYQGEIALSPSSTS